MKRCDFLTIAAGAALAARAIRRADAPAPTRSETLIPVQEYGPTSMDMNGIGSAWSATPAVASPPWCA